MVNPELEPQAFCPNSNRTLGDGQDSIGLSKDIDQVNLARNGLQVRVAGLPQYLIFFRVDRYDLVPSVEQIFRHTEAGSGGIAG